MKITDEHDVTLTANERAVQERAGYFKTLGVDPIEAVEAALGEMTVKPTKQFVEWVSDGHLTFHKGEVERVPAEAATS